MYLKLSLILLLAILQTGIGSINCQNNTIPKTIIAQACAYQDFQLPLKDYNPEDKQAITILRLRYVNAEEIAQFLYNTGMQNNNEQDNNLAILRIMVNPKINALILVGPETVLAEMEAYILQEIDILS